MVERNCSCFKRTVLHGATTIANYLQNEDLVRVQWLAQIPDLNRFENICGSMKTRLKETDVL